MDEAAKAAHRNFAVSLFNRVWELLDKTDRSAADDEVMLNAAHASLYHWLQIGEAKNFSIGEWQLARVYATLRRTEPALHHAQRSLDIAENAALPAFYIAYGHEAVARAHALNGDSSAVRTHTERARILAESVENADERAMLLKDLDGLQ